MTVLWLFKIDHHFSYFYDHGYSLLLVSFFVVFILIEGANGGTQFSANYYFFRPITVNYYFFWPILS